MVWMDVFSNENYHLVLVFLYSFFATLVASRYFIRQLYKRGFVVEDKYKRDRPKIASMGGIAIFAGLMVSLALSSLLMIHNNLISSLFVFYFIVTVYAMYGVVDDLFAFKKRYDKILVLLVLSLPIGALVVSPSELLLFNHSLYLGAFLPYVVAPVYVMVVANLVNLHSGFNGLSSGLGLILLFAIGLKSFMVHGTENLLFLLPILGATLAFYPNTLFPARALEGNIGQFMIGAAVGGLLIINQLEIFGIIILIPHVVNFIMDTVVLGVLKVPDVKYGSVRRDGSVIAPPSMRFKSLKFLLTHYIRLSERKATFALYIPTILFSAVGVMFF